MNKILMGLAAFCLVASIVYKRWAVSYTLRKLYRLRQMEDSRPFIEAVDSELARFHFSKFTRTFMKLNYWIGREAHEEVQVLIPVIESMKCSAAEQTALYSKLFGYTLEQGQYGAAQEYQKKLEALLKGRTDRRSAAVRQEVDQLERVYLKRDVSAIPELEAALDTAAGETEAVICYRLAKLYYAKGDEDRTAEYLKRACRCTSNGPAKRKLEQAARDHSILM